MEDTQSILAKAHSLLQQGKKEEAKQLLDDAFINTKETKDFKAQLEEHDDDLAICSKELFMGMHDLTDTTFDLMLDLCNDYVRLSENEEFVMYGRKAIKHITADDEYDFRRQYAVQSGLIPNCMSREDIRQCYDISNNTINLAALAGGLIHMTDDFEDDEAMFKLTEKFERVFQSKNFDYEEVPIMQVSKK